MKLIYNVFLFACLSLHLQASNELLGVALVGALTGTSIAAGNSANYDNLAESELESWRHKKTNSSTRIFKDCGLNYELKVIGNRRLNSVIVVIHNPGDENIIIKPEEVAIEFSNGVRKYPDFYQMPSDIEIKSHWRFKGIIPIQEKSLFKNVSSLTVTIPVYETNNELRCTMEGVIKRQSPVQAQEYSHSNYLDLIFGFGVGLVEDNNSYPDKPASFHFEWNLYPWPNKGFTFGVVSRSHGGDNSNVVAQKLSGGGDINIRDFSSYLGYVQRWSLGSKHSLMAQVGVSFDVTDVEYLSSSFNRLNNLFLTSREVHDKLGGYFQLSYDYMFARSFYGFWTGDYSVGVGYRHQYSNPTSISGIEFGGHRGAAVLYIRMAL